MDREVEATQSESGDRGGLVPERTRPSWDVWGLRMQRQSLRLVFAVTALGCLAYAGTSLGVEMPPWRRAPTLLLALVSLGLAVRPPRRHQNEVAWAFLCLLFAVSIFGLYFGGGLQGTAAYMPFLVLLCAAFLTGSRGLLIFTPGVLITVITIFVLDRSGSLPPAGELLSHASLVAALSVEIIGGSVFLILVTRQIQRLLAEGRQETQRLEASETRLRGFYDSAFEGIVLSRRGVIIDANERAASLVGHSVEEAIGRRIADFIPDADLKGLLEKVGSADGAPYEHRLVDREGNEFPIRARSRTLELSDGRALSTVFQDLRAEADAAAERQRLEANLLAAQKFETAGALAAGVAHDLNNILAGISAFLSLAGEQVGENEQLGSDLREAMAATERGRLLSRQFLSATTQGQLSLRKTDADAVLDEVADLLNSTLPPSTSIEVRIRGELRPIHADPDALHQILLALCINAFQALPGKSGHIELGATLETLDQWQGRFRDLEEGTYVALRVKDDGAGMEPETLEHCFEPFYSTRGEGEAKGTGMGLPVVRSVVQAHGGAISIETAPGSGTEITLHLPLFGPGAQMGPEAPASPPPASPEAAPPTEHPVRVVYIDDESMLCRAMRRILESNGMEVTTFERPDHALREIQPGAYDVIITDFAMPELSGIELSRALRARGIEAPIVLCSGNPGAVEAAELEEVRIGKIVPKPFRFDELTGAIGALLAEDASSKG